MYAAERGAAVRYGLRCGVAGMGAGRAGLGGGIDNSFLTIVQLLYNQAFKQFKMGYASAMAWVLFVIILILTLLVMKSSEAWTYYEGESR